MTAFAVGDIQGCYDPLMRLLDKIDFDPSVDTLWVAGDIVNRGPNSLETLRFLKGLGKSCIAILGNHDLHLLAVDAGVRKQKKDDTLDQVLAAPDKDELIDWLRHNAFLHHNKQMNITMVHAGIPPIWTLDHAIIQSKNLERALRADDYYVLLQVLFKSDELAGSEEKLRLNKELRQAASYFTRMRFCNAEGRLDRKHRSVKPDKGFAPWFTYEHAPMYNETILFGHWAALKGKTGRKNIYALDTGCVWGRELTAVSLQTFERISVSNKCY